MLDSDPRGAVRASLEAAQRGDPAIWISLVASEQALARADEVAAGGDLRLRGLTFAVKDNIDVAGMPTSAACPAFSYTPDLSATVVTRLEQAGAVLIGKTNLDQFATGLVGTRSPYGVPENPLAAGYIPGGSSSGSAVAVARGMVSFSLGTDTAGSGRVPAGFNGIVGYKPTRGLLSTAGVVPACRTLDCVSVFAPSMADARRVAEACQGVDPADPFSRVGAPLSEMGNASVRAGVPRPDQLEFFGNDAYRQEFARQLARAGDLGWEPLEIDLQPLREAANLLYTGAYLAERLLAVSPLIDDEPDALLPVTRGIIEAGRDLSAADYFRGAYRLQELQVVGAQMWKEIDVLLLPTSGTIYTRDEVDADPVGTNTNLGYYTNFVNLLDMCGVAVPAGVTDTGLPFGVTLLGPAWADGRVMDLGGKMMNEQPDAGANRPAADDTLDLAVFGLHLEGQPLNGQLTDLGARLVARTRTDDAYRLYVIPGSDAPQAAGTPAALEKPGAVRGERGSGSAIELEVWRVPIAGVGSFLAKIPPPLGLGTVMIEDGTTVKGFICEQWIAASARDITALGGWRAYLEEG